MTYLPPLNLAPKPFISQLFFQSSLSDSSEIEELWSGSNVFFAAAMPKSRCIVGFNIASIES
ncbi:hypothetical protein Syun_024516 [Stephania yunnanensis]|uniref:Uncharacterized protein n=1 Tax=Stephania yunnanensis TaxID=152371 RepID=A0AAP0NJ86_9MAGN